MSVVVHTLRVAAGAVLLHLVAVSQALAADAPSAVVRTRIEPAGGVAVGQGATLYVDVFTDAFFTSGIELPALSVPGAIVKLSDERPPHISRRIQGAEWPGIEHKYSITPIVAEDLTIPAFEVSARLGPASQEVTLKVPAKQLSVTAPPGSEGAFVTRDLQASQKTDQDLSSLKVGDAFTRTVELTATGTPAMFIPDVSFGEIDGLTAYPQTPKLVDSAPDASRMVGRRTFAVNYVVQKAGDYELPAIDIRWWDLDTGTIKTATAEALRAHAVAAAASQPAFSLPVEEVQPAPARKIDWRRLGIYVACAIAAIGLVWWLAPFAFRAGRALIERLRRRHQRYLQSEPYAYTQLRAALRRGKEPDVLAALYRWLDRVPAGRGASHPVQTLHATRNDALISAGGNLMDDLYTQKAAHSSAVIDLRRALPEARHALPGLAPAAVAHQAALGPLNPD